MAASGEVLRRNLPVNLGSCVGSCKGSAELHVLAVDDSLVDRKVIEKLLKTFSCKVTAVESGRRALQFLGLEGEKASSVGLKVNLIMTDYSMPGMTGYELLKKIKGSSDFRDVPVVIMSSETILARINRCLEEGAEEFLEKPVKFSDIERLTKILAREEPEDDSEEDNNNTRKRKLLLQSETDDESRAPESPLSNRRASDSPKRLRRV